MTALEIIGMILLLFLLLSLLRVGAIVDFGGELLYGLLLPSGNDAAECIADHCGGGVELSLIHI